MPKQYYKYAVTSFLLAPAAQVTLIVCVTVIIVILMLRGLLKHGAEIHIKIYPFEIKITQTTPASAPEPSAPEPSAPEPSAPEPSAPEPPAPEPPNGG